MQTVTICHYLKRYMAKSKAKILVVDDNSGIRAALKVLLPLHFSQVELIPSPKELVTKLADFRPDVVLLDMNFHTDINTGNEGLYWLSEIKKRTPETEVVLFTAYADIQLAVEGMKRGAFDFIVKPWDNEKLVETLKGAYDRTGKKEKAVVAPSSMKMFWGKGPAMSGIRQTVEKIASTDATVLITGENGTGKDVLAGEIHRSAERLQNLINDIIKLSELDDDEQELEKEMVDLHEIAKDCVATMEYTAEKNEVSLCVRGEHILANVNKDLVDELIYNLCSNLHKLLHTIQCLLH